MYARYDDRLWGAIELREQALAEIAESRPVQRLKGIHQAGASYYLLPGKHPDTRFDHSLGVLYVLQALGADLEEQVAGLLHDVPHTAFSHTVDIVFPNDEHNFHERFQHDVIMASEIPSILARHSLPLRAALEPDRYPLLERPLPDLCADRIDYSLRGLHSIGEITAAQALSFLGHLVPTAEGILVDDAETAMWYAGMFAAGNDLLWTGPDEAGSYWALAGAIKRAYALDAFTDADLFTDDETAMSKLRSPGDPVVDAYLRLLAPGTRFYEVEGDGPHITTHMKQRAVDPLVREPGWPEARHLSALFPAHAKRLAERGFSGSINYRLWADGMEHVAG